MRKESSRHILYTNFKTTQKARLRPNIQIINKNKTYSKEHKTTHKQKLAKGNKKFGIIDATSILRFNKAYKTLQ